MDHYGPRNHPDEGKSPNSHPLPPQPHRSTSLARIHNEDYADVWHLASLQKRTIADVLCDATKVYIESLASAGLDGTEPVEEERVAHG